MRRSVREALVGFSLLAALASGLGLWLWLKGISLARANWVLRATFQDAAGLARRSPVSYRGVLVGRVKDLRVNDREVVADLEITDPDLRLARPLIARVGASSLLGGDAEVALISSGTLPIKGPGPRDRRCDNRLQACERGQVQGQQAPSIATVTATVQKLLDQTDSEDLVTRLVESTNSFRRTAREAEKLSTRGQAFVDDAQTLVQSLNAVVGRTDPIVTNLSAASLEARQATTSMKRLAARLENPATAADLEATLANARQLTERWSAVGGDVRKLTDDPAFIDGLKRVSMGLGRFFDDLYPGGSPPGARAARSGGRAAAAATPQTPAGVRYESPDGRMAPRSRAPATPPRRPSRRPSSPRPLRAPPPPPGRSRRSPDHWPWAAARSGLPPPQQAPDPCRCR